MGESRVAGPKRHIVGVVMYDGEDEVVGGMGRVAPYNVSVSC